MRRNSTALRNFKNSIAIAETLLKSERRFNDPPPPRSIKMVQGLRGGALVLMVGSFENYLKEVMEERLTELSASPKFNFSSLPLDIIHYNYRQTFYHSLHPTSKLNNSQKIVRFQKASHFIMNSQINPEAFSVSIRSNPNSEKLKEFFNSIGFQKFFSKIKPKFEKKIGKYVAQTEIEDTLDFIVNQRHTVAHSANALNLSRQDLEKYLIFLKTLSDICDDELYFKIRTFNK